MLDFLDFFRTLQKLNLTFKTNLVRLNTIKAMDTYPEIDSTKTFTTVDEEHAILLYQRDRTTVTLGNIYILKHK